MAKAQEGAPAPAATEPGKVESLADLAREAADQDRAEQLQQTQARDLVEAGQQREQQQQQAAAATEVAALLGVVRTMAAPAVEGMGYLKPGQTAQIWSDQVLEAASGPLVAIMDRHGVGLGDLMESWGPYAMLFVATAIPAVATVKAVRENREEKEAADQARTVEASATGATA